MCASPVSHTRLSEDGILAYIDRYFPDASASASLLLGRGDDCAVLRGDGDMCVSADIFAEDVHFRRRYFTPTDVGHKALAVNISDIAAMGAQPAAFTLCLGLPPDVDAAWLEGFLAGMARLAQRYALPLVGGDLSAADKVHITVTIWGRKAAGVPHFLRRGVLEGDAPRPVQAGDVLFTVGPLGLARAGLLALEGDAQAARTYPDAVRAHLTPEPQVAAGLALARSGVPMALMDLSDGLARDVPRLLGHGLRPSTGDATGQPALGAALVLNPENLHPDVRRYTAASGEDPCVFACLGGEDYALLGACAPADVPALRRALPQLMPVGTVTASAGLTLAGQPLPAQGFDHFANATA